MTTPLILRAPPRTKGDSALVSDLLPPVTVKTRATAEGGSKKRHSYKPLPKEFRRDGFTYRQIHRKGDFAIYQQTWKGNEDSAAFEVIRIRQRDGFEIGGRFVEPAEVYPPSEAWGTDGWTMPDKDSARRKLRELVNARKKNRRIP